MDFREALAPAESAGRYLPTPSLATLLLECLHFYGYCFDPQRHAIAPYLNGTGHWGSGFVARQAGGRGTSRDDYAHHPLLIADPVLVDNNIGQNCYRIGQIQTLFRDAASAAKAAAMEAVVRASAGDPPDPDALVRQLLAGSTMAQEEVKPPANTPGPPVPLLQPPQPLLPLPSLSPSALEEQSSS